MVKTAFDNDLYIRTQSAHIRSRIEQFGGKLYLEFGGKLYDDNHASRVLPGFKPDSKLQMLLRLKDKVEMVIAINTADIEKNKVRGDLGITYDRDVIRLIGIFRDFGLYVSSVVLTRFSGQSMAKAFQNRLEAMDIKVYHHYEIPGYPYNIAQIVSGQNEYIETTRELVVVTAPGPGSGKLATCLSQLYHEHKRGVKAGYAKFETFPVWNLPLKHPVNVAYEAATVDLNDVTDIILILIVTPILVDEQIRDRQGHVYGCNHLCRTEDFNQQRGQSPIVHGLSGFVEHHDPASIVAQCGSDRARI